MTLGMDLENDRDKEGVYQGDWGGWLEPLLLRTPDKEDWRMVPIGPGSRTYTAVNIQQVFGKRLLSQALC